MRTRRVNGGTGQMKNKKQIENQISKIEKTHSKGQSICETALLQLEEIFKDLDGFSHCQTAPDGSMEIIIDYDDGMCPGDWCITTALKQMELEGLL